MDIIILENETEQDLNTERSQEMNQHDEAEERIFPEKNEDDRSSYALRQLIGFTGLVFPLFLWIMAGLRPTEGLQSWELLGSISAYFFTNAVPVFAGILVALGLFLFAYRGYKNEYGYRDRIAAIVAGVSAILIAFFPAETPGNLPQPSWWIPLMCWIHYVSAAALFGSFIFFSLFQFTKSKPGNLDPEKRIRNSIYTICGVAIISSLVWAVIASIMDASIFWPETLALEFFAFSWLIKGRADVSAIAVGKRALYYGRHPKQLIGKARNALQGK